MQHNPSVSSNSSKNWIQPALSWRVFFVKLNSERVHWTLASHRHLAFFTTEHGIAPPVAEYRREGREGNRPKYGVFYFLVFVIIGGVNDGSVQLFCRC